MTQISLIAAIDEYDGLGKNNALLCHLPADLRHFKQKTMGKPVIMGRKTFESIGKPLPGRLNIVISRQLQPQTGVQVVDSLEKALILTADSEEAMIIGGAQLFEQALPLASRLYLTRIHQHFEADVFFPHWDQQDWRCVEKTSRSKDAANPIDLTFYCYERISVNSTL